MMMTSLSSLDENTTETAERYRRPTRCERNGTVLNKACALLTVILATCLMAAICYILTNKEESNSTSHSEPLVQKDALTEDYLDKLKELVEINLESAQNITTIIQSHTEQIQTLEQINEETQRILAALKAENEAAHDKINSQKMENEEANKRIISLELKYDAVNGNVTELEVMNSETKENVFAIAQNIEERILALEQRNNGTIIEIQQNTDAAQNKMGEIELQNEVVKNKITAIEFRTNVTEHNLNIINLNPVPVGFIYVQLPGRDAPTTLWPQVKWKDIGSDFAGLFFRVEGANAAQFGTLQEENTRRLAQVYYSSITTRTDPLIPADGTWSQFAFTGRDKWGSDIGLKFRLTTGEIRPRNTAVKLWQRVN